LRGQHARRLRAHCHAGLTNVTYRYIELLADNGLAEACEKQPALLSGVNIMNGKVTQKAVADAHGMKYEPVSF
jgi:alanine dehydrogenase